jgi:hypothetical protein
LKEIESEKMSNILKKNSAGDAEVLWGVSESDLGFGTENSATFYKELGIAGNSF